MFDWLWETPAGQEMSKTSTEIRFWMTLTGWCAVIGVVLVGVNVLINLFRGKSK